jgi:WD40 repeat protein
MARTKNPLGFELRLTLPGHGVDSQITQVAWSPDGKVIASCGDDATIRLWNANTGEQIRALREHDKAVYSLAWSPEGRTLASGSDDKRIRLWDSDTGKSLRTLEGHSKTVATLAWSSDGGTLASGSYDGTVRLWSPANRWKSRTIAKDSIELYGLEWLADGNTLAMAGYNRDIELWYREKQKVTEELRGISGSSTYSLASTNAGKMLAAGYWDGTIRLWNTLPGQGFPSHDLNGHTGSVEALSFSPDGSLLLSKSSDDTVRLWHCRTQQVLSVLRETTSEEWVGGIAFHPTESVFATLGKEDTEIRIWRLNTEALLGKTKSPPPSLKLTPNNGAGAEFGPTDVAPVAMPSAVGRMKGGIPSPSHTARRSAGRISVFVSYSHEDLEYLDRLRTFLKLLERNRPGVFDFWDDSRIPPSGLWEKEIQNALKAANVALLLISVDFLASEFIKTVELPALLAKERARGLVIVPIILKPCPFRLMRELAQFQAINPKLKSVLEMNEVEREKLWTTVYEFLHARLIEPEK